LVDVRGFGMVYKLAPPGSFKAETQDMTKLHAHDIP